MTMKRRFRSGRRTRVARRYPPLSTTRDPEVRDATRALLNSAIAGSKEGDDA